MAMVLSGHFFWSPLSRLIKNRDTHHVDEPPRYNPKPRRAGRDTGKKASFFSLHHLTIGRLPTFGAFGTRVTWMSSSRLLSGSSGSGSAAARMGTVQNKRRFARKPLIKMHWFSVGDGLFY